MKKLYALFFVPLSLTIGGLVISSCNRTSPEEEVRSYSRYFIEKLAANQIDSLQSAYPEIVMADSIIPIQSDTIIVEKTNDGNFNVTLMDGVSLKINRAKDGHMTVKESNGLFAFSKDKLMIAEKTGMLTDSLSDVAIQEKLSDDEFFNYIQNIINDKKNNILIISGGKVTNNSNKTIEGNDYNVIKAFYVRGMFMGAGSTSYSDIKGKTLEPGKSMNISLVQALMGIEYLSGIKWVISEEEFLTKYAALTGNEYQEYLSSKK